MRTLLCAACLLTMSLGGCASSGSTQGLDAALASYRRGHYVQARDQARGIAASLHSHDRHAASYLAGLCSYQLDELDDAEPRLLYARGASDRETAARATAMLAMIRLSRGQTYAAAGYFAEAYDLLPRTEAEQAARHAALAYDEAGDSASAARWHRLADLGVGPYAPEGPDVMATGEFTLQVGAFLERERAETAAADAQAVTNDAGVGPVEVLDPAAVGGGSLYLVQFGRFSTRSAAAAIRSELGHLEYIVVPRIVVR